MQLIGKGVGIFLAERFGASGYFSTFADAFHEVAHGEVLLDVFGSVECPSVVDGVSIFADDTVGEGDVGGDDKVAGLAEFDDAVIGFVGTLIDEKVFDVTGGADGDLLVGDDLGRDRKALDGAQDDGFEQIGKCIPVDEQGHTISLTRPTSPLSRRTLIP